MTGLAANRASALAALADPVRRRIYDAVAAEDDAVGRDAAATAAGVPRSTAAFHLDRLVEAGLLTVEYRRLSGRTGPGAGRPAKLYRPVTAELIGSIPERHYELAADILAAAADRADHDGTRAHEAAVSEAGDRGRELGRDAESLEAALQRCGYAPEVSDTGRITLGNCPFHLLARRHERLVCAVNLALVNGLIEGAGDARHADPIPREGACCVEIRPPRAGADRGYPTKTRDQSA